MTEMRKLNTLDKVEEFCRLAAAAAASYRPKAVLTEKNATDIFLLKHRHGFPTDHAASCFLAKKYSVSSKTIRDIWSGRSWLETTFDLWDTADRPDRKLVGRPKGSKNSKPKRFNAEYVVENISSRCQKIANSSEQMQSLDAGSFKEAFAAAHATNCSDPIHGLSVPIRPASILDMLKQDAAWQTASAHCPYEQSLQNSAWSHLGFILPQPSQLCCFTTHPASPSPSPIAGATTPPPPPHAALFAAAQLTPAHPAMPQPCRPAGFDPALRQAALRAALCAAASWPAPRALWR